MGQVGGGEDLRLRFGSKRIIEIRDGTTIEASRKIHSHRTSIFLQIFLFFLYILSKRVSYFFFCFCFLFIQWRSTVSWPTCDVQRKEAMFCQQRADILSDTVPLGRVFWKSANQFIPFAFIFCILRSYFSFPHLTVIQSSSRALLCPIFLLSFFLSFCLVLQHMLK